MPLLCQFTDRDEAVEQTFLNGELVIRTRSGLHPVEAALIEQLPALVKKIAGKKILVCQTRTGATNAALHLLLPDAAQTIHTYDAHHARSIRRNLQTLSSNAANETNKKTTIHSRPFASFDDHNLQILCTPFLPSETFDAAFLLITHNAMSNELLQDLLQNIRLQLAPGAPLVIAFESLLEPTRKLLAPLFEKPAIKVLNAKSDPPIHLAIARRPAGELKRVCDFSATFNASLPGVPPFELTTWPGVFAHRRTDEGGLALAETAATLLRPNERILDIGCGSGFVGIALALSQSAPSHVTFLDAHSRAVYAADFNARHHKLPDFATYLSPAADFTPAKPNFTLALANPPYFSDYKIAKAFIELARRSLAPRGRLLIVTQQTAFYKEYLPELFPRVEPLHRRSYALFLVTQP